MRYFALASDYDGTLAEPDGTVAPATLNALERLKGSGRRLILVTGRELHDLQSTFDRIDLFDLAVVENGAVIYRPADRSTKMLAEPPSEDFVNRLHELDVAPLGLGRVIVSTSKPHETEVLQAIQELGLEMQIIFNKGSVMVLPSGVNKATGLGEALVELGLSPHNLVGVGDAENDHAFLSSCECGVAVANALPMLKDRADMVTKGANGSGVTELVEGLLRDDLAEASSRIARHNILIGKEQDGRESWLEPYGSWMLIAGPSGSGKSKATTALLERLASCGYQFCLVDPEGDYNDFECAVRLGDPRRIPTIDEVLEVLARPSQNVTVNLLGVKLEDRPGFFSSLVPRLIEMRSRTGRPHWLVVDEAHHMLPVERRLGPLVLPSEFQGVMLVTVHVDKLAAAAIEPTTTVVAVGQEPDATIATVSKSIGARPPKKTNAELDKGRGQVLVWHRRAGLAPAIVELEPAASDHQRHQRKYAVGALDEDECFYFRGPKGKLNLKAQNLALFSQLAQGIDDETWQYHLRRRDYSDWFARAIKDDQLAAAAAGVERDKSLSPAQSRERIVSAIEGRYTLAA